MGLFEGIEPRTATILSGASLSNEIDLEGYIPVGIAMPAAWTAANLTFEEGGDGDSYDSAGIELTAVAAVNRHITLDPIEFAGFRSISIRSGTTGVPVNQGGDREVILLVRKLS